MDRRHADVTLISGERFVSAVAGQRHRYMLTRQFGKIVGRQSRGIGERFVEMPNHLWQDRYGVGLNHEFFMFSLVSLGHLARERKLVMGGFVESDRKGAERT